MQNKWLLALGIAFFVTISLGGCQPAPPFSLKVQLLKPELLKSIRFLDLALFIADKLNCSEINSKNYNSSEDKINSARLLNRGHSGSIVGLKFTAADYTEDSKGGKLEQFVSHLGDGDQLAQHPNGLKVNIYMLALAEVNKKKEAIAEGCTSFVLKRGVTQSLSLSLTEPK